jgi:D-serine deaminase-like pyridoxal phosphate-dependent protein
LRDARSAAVVSVVVDAATRWDCRFVVAAAAARLRAAGVLDAEVRAARAVLADSPRALAAFDDAARDAAVRFDAGVSDSSAGVGFGFGSAAPEAAFAAVLRAGRGLRAGFCADSGVTSSSADALGEPAAPVLAAPVAVLPVERGATADPRTADTPVPVPSGASSSCVERETEVTQTTYQSLPLEPSCDVPRRRGTCAFPERGITIPLRPPTLRGARRWYPIS